MFRVFVSSFVRVIVVPEEAPGKMKVPIVLVFRRGAVRFAMSARM